MTGSGIVFVGDHKVKPVKLVEAIIVQKTNN